MEKSAPVTFIYVFHSLDNQANIVNEDARNAKNMVIDFILKKIILKTD